jgi:rRNA maturation endonuclease Nob1
VLPWPRPFIDFSRSDILEVDSREPSEFNFEISAPTYFGSAASRDRLAALCARYGLPQEMESFHTPPTEASPRVTKTPKQRMRVSCHNCNTTYKGDRVCSKCGHAKCGDCKRHSITASTTSSEKLAEDVEVMDDAPSKEPESAVRELPRPVVETAKYNCHKCQAEFATSTNAICEQCGHEKCNRCSRQVLHLADLGDDRTGKARDLRQNRVYRPAKQRVRHYCDQCSVMFPARTNVCPSCSHKRCKNCTRRPTKKRRMAPGAEGEGIVEQSIVGQHRPILSESGAHGEASRS